MSRRHKKKRRNGTEALVAIVISIVLSVYAYSESMVVTIVFACICTITPWSCRFIAKRLRRRRYLRSSLAQIDAMDGHEFEEYLENQFKKMGYRVENVGAGGHDYGVDLIIGRNGEKTAVQAKRYQGNVGIKAVQEIVSGKQYYHTQYAMVVTNSHFTLAAMNMAEECDVILWDRDMCREKFRAIQE